MKSKYTLKSLIENIDQELEKENSPQRKHLESAINYLAPFTEGLHISDNSGEEDTNEYFDSNFWFLPHLKSFSNLKYIAIETKPATKDRIEFMYKLLKSNL